MGRRTAPLLPRISRHLKAVGENLRLARRRRKLTAKQVAERAGMSVNTLRSVERGHAGATIGAYAAALHVLGMDADLLLLAGEDVVGRRLQDAAISGSKRSES